MVWSLRTKCIVVALTCFTASWLVMAVNAEDKPGTTVTKTSNWPVKFTIREVKPAVAPPAVAQRTHEIKQPFYPALTSSEQAIQEALQSKVDFSFPKTPLPKVLDSLRDQHGINIFLPADVLENEGLKPDHPVSIAMKGVSLKSALEMILKPLNLDYVVDNEVVKIMPAYEANRTYKMRIYPVADLCSTPEDYDILRDVIRNARLGEWKPDGINQLGPSVTSFGNGVSAQNHAFEGGTISILPRSQSLVISQNYDAHNAIVEFLSLLRQVRQDEQGLSTENK